MRLILIADGPPREQSTNSGVALGLYTALRRRPDVEIVQALDGRLHGAGKRIALARATCVNPRRLRSEFLFGSTGIRARSRQRDEALLDEGCGSAVVIHVRNVYEPTRRMPYCAFIDSTTALILRNWPDWQKVIGTPHARIEAERAYYRNAQVVFTASRVAARSVVVDYGVPAERVAVVGGGVRFDPLPAAPTPRTAGNKSPVKVLFVGTDFRRKGGDLLVRAVASLRDQGHPTEMDIAGVDEIPHAPDWCRFHGRVSDPYVLRTLYKNADIFALPARHEPYGLVLQEAMAFALPCVGTRVGAMAEIIDEGRTGLLVQPDHVDGLVEALRSLVVDPRLRRSMGVRGRHKVETSLTWDAVASRIIHRLVG